MPKEINKTKEEISLALKTFRELKGWSHKRVASYVKATEETVKGWEAGKTKPSDKIVKWLFRKRATAPVTTNLPPTA